MSMYKYIRIEAIPAPMEDVLDPHSEYNQGVARERDIAESALYLAERVKHLEFLVQSYQRDNNDAH